MIVLLHCSREKSEKLSRNLIGRTSDVPQGMVSLRHHTTAGVRPLGVVMNHCNNGGCTKPVYRGKECLRCWLGTKWDSMQQRIRNRMGNCNSYVGIPLAFGRRDFIAWATDNPPPVEMKSPSIDRINPKLGYVFGNIRWLEFSRNSSGKQRDIPEGFYLCCPCKRVLPLSAFGVNNSKRWGKKIQSHCRECRKNER